MVNMCCPCCSIIQQYREVDTRWNALQKSNVNKVGYQQGPTMQMRR